ncbi:hypothetical protein FNYG_15517 [Fusarium nygamai]|uniref:Major facilitator superfamily (MFS) profile domain-containing protein n=1 Tax=Gibberella nygamai TaxID=42673 RepID=A0A2K0UC83_GIBNY|nr:hypothetical protein FNYG_15517 [Fusarium nygamai]
MAAPAFIQLVGFYFVTKSPRWLISKYRTEEGLAFFAMYHAEGDINNALVQFEYNEIRESIAFEKSLDRSGTLQNYLEFVRNRGNRKRVFILFWTVCMAQMSGNAFLSYYLVPILTTVGLRLSLQQVLINTTQQMFS